MKIQPCRFPLLKSDYRLEIIIIIVIDQVTYRSFRFVFLFTANTRIRCLLLLFLLDVRFFGKIKSMTKSILIYYFLSTKHDTDNILPRCAKAGRRWGDGSRPTYDEH